MHSEGRTFAYFFECIVGGEWSKMGNRGFRSVYTSQIATWTRSCETCRLTPTNLATSEKSGKQRTGTTPVTVSMCSLTCQCRWAMPSEDQRRFLQTLVSDKPHDVLQLNLCNFCIIWDTYPKEKINSSSKLQRDPRCHNLFFLQDSLHFRAPEGFCVSLSWCCHC